MSNMFCTVDSMFATSALIGMRPSRTSRNMSVLKKPDNVFGGRDRRSPYSSSITSGDRVITPVRSKAMAVIIEWPQHACIRGSRTGLGRLLGEDGDRSGCPVYFDRRAVGNDLGAVAGSHDAGNAHLARNDRCVAGAAH